MTKTISAEQLDLIVADVNAGGVYGRENCETMLALVADLKAARAENESLRAANERWQQSLAWIEAVHESRGPLS